MSPIYEYKCPKCGHIIERLMSIHDEWYGGCPKCNTTMEKVPSVSSFHLKGSGWTETKKTLLEDDGV